MGDVLELRPSGPDCVERASGGVIDSPFSYNYRTHLPEVRGLACPEVWGPVPWTGSHDSDIPNDPRREGLGHVELPEPVPHPLNPEVALRNVPVIAPGLRGFVQLDAATSHARLRAMRDALLSQDAEPHAKMLGEVGLWDADRDRALTDAEIAAIDPIDEESALDRAYRAVVNHAGTLKRLLDGGEAPDPVLDDLRGRLRGAIHALFEAVESAELPPNVVYAATARCLLD